MDKTNQSIIFEILQVKPIAFNPILAKITGSIKAGLFLSQLLYWSGKEKDREGWIFKTIDEFEEETALSRHEQDEAIKKLKRLNIIKVELKGIPAKRHFQINFQVLLSLLKSSKQVCQKVANKPAKKWQTNTDITQNITTYIKRKENEKKEINLKGEEIKKEYEEVVDHFNACFKRRFKAIDGNLKNFTYWRNLYNLQEIKDAIKIATTDNFWYNKLTPTILFRQKNPQGEPVDYIGGFLNKKRFYDFKKSPQLPKEREENFKPVSEEKVKEMRFRIDQILKNKSF